MRHDLDITLRAFRPTHSGDAPHIVGIGGTTRIGSSSETALRLALAEAVRLGATAEMIAGPLLDLPAYDPANDHRSPSAQRLVQALRRADGIIIATPSYHGGMSGIIKNAIDYAEDMRGDARPYFDGRAVGVIVTAYGTQALGTTLSGVRSIVHALRGWPTPFAAAINAQTTPFENGRVTQPEVEVQLATVAGQVVQFARAMGAFSGYGNPADAAVEVAEGR
ncbi:NADPH-dependent FMN reductase [Amorphus sp. 3PC139-8]|uniref:NADPH-dependent FMN reductase n=1 Tax=Amorphus sp. 3PC139-8 TaxID=2735676 RepID=UPI00345C92E5